MPVENESIGLVNYVVGALGSDAGFASTTLNCVIFYEACA